MIKSKGPKYVSDTSSCIYFGKPCLIIGEFLQQKSWTNGFSFYMVEV